MNIIKTVGDLRKALSAYEDNLRLNFEVGDTSLDLNNDTQIFQTLNADTFELEKVSLVFLLK